MARPPKGKPLTLRPIRLDDDVWAECQRLGKEHGTINEGLRTCLFEDLIEPLKPAAVESVIRRAGQLAAPLLKRGPQQKGDRTR